MPFSVPALYMTHQVRKYKTPFQKAHNLSSIWYYRVYGYLFFGSLLTFNEYNYRQHISIKN